MQKSLPWPGVSPASGADAGRFTAPEWWGRASAEGAGGGILRAIAAPLRTDPVFANIGVYYCVPNRLLVTDPVVNNQVDIDTGAALVEGNYFYNDASVSITDLPAAATSYIVVRKNYTNALYNPGGGSEVPPYTARLTWVPAIVQDPTRATYWDMPLATVTTVAGVVTIDSDDREFGDAETKRLLVPYVGGWDQTNTTPLPLGVGGTQKGLRGWVTLANATSRAYTYFAIPNNYIDNIRVWIVWVGHVAGGVARLTHEIYYGECLEDFNLNIDDAGPSSINGGGDVTMCSLPVDLDGGIAGGPVTIGDIVRVAAIRTGGHIDDTYSYVHFTGALIEYFGWKR